MDVIWKGTFGSTWSNSANWLNNIGPTSVSNVYIGTQPQSTFTTFTGAATVNQLVMDGSYGGKLGILGTLNVDYSAGFGTPSTATQIRVGGNITVASSGVLNVVGGIDNFGLLDLWKAAGDSLIGGSVIARGIFNGTSGVIIKPADASLQARTLNNSGTITSTGVLQTGEFYNAGPGTLVITGLLDGMLQQDSDSTGFIRIGNAGTAGDNLSIRDDFRFYGGTLYLDVRDGAWDTVTVGGGVITAPAEIVINTLLSASGSGFTTFEAGYSATLITSTWATNSDTLKATVLNQHADFAYYFAVLEDSDDYTFVALNSGATGGAATLDMTTATRGVAISYSASLDTAAVVGGIFKGNTAQSAVWVPNTRTFVGSNFNDGIVVTGTATAEDSIVFSGFGGDDLLSGGGANDVLFGGVGSDTLIGSGGSDSLYGDTDDDTIDGGAGGDALSGGSGADDMTGGSGSDKLLGGAGDDILTGGTGYDELNGGSGSDTMYGGAGSDLLRGSIGDDLYIISSVKTVIKELAGQGIDLVQTPFDTVLGDNVENAMLTGDAVTDLTGNALVNVLSGNEARNVLKGMDANDVLLGLGGDDLLRGGTGNDTLSGGGGRDMMMGDAGGDYLTGGGGSDLFVLRHGDGVERISDFMLTGIERDFIDLSAITAITGFSDLIANHARQRWFGVEINAGNGDYIYIDNIVTSELSADNFLF